MLKSALEKNLIPAINDSVALAQIFVVILFFENYLILVQGTSLFKITIDFTQINLSPFISFFIFIAAFKIFWWLFHFMLIQVKLKLDWDNENFPISSNIHFLAFLLIWLLGFYFYNIYKDEHKFMPFDVQKYSFLFNLYQMIGIISLLLAVFIVFFSDIKYKGEQ